MRATITRSVVVSTVNGYTIEIQDGKPTVKELEPVTVYGKLTKDKATKELKRVYGKDSAVSVNTVTEEEKQYEISVADFVKYAKVVEPADAKTQENAETENEKKAEVN